MKSVAVAVLLALGACHGGDTRAKRTGSAAPVEILTGLPDAGHAGPGPTSDEIEPNDADEVATPLAIGGTARGRVEGDNDADFYRIEVEKAGTLQVMLTGVEGQDLTLELAESSGTSVAKSDRGATRIKEGIPNAGVTPGKYDLIVRQAPKKKTKPAKAPKGKKGAAAAGAGSDAAAPPAPVYELTAQLITPDKNAEHEPDDDQGTANDLIVTDNATGFLGWSNDKDVWKLSVETLSAKNPLDIQVSAIEGVALELEIADGVGNVLATRKAPKNTPLIVRSLLPVVPEGAPPFHYLTIKGSASNPETSYTLHAQAHPLGADEELEPNDLVDKPAEMNPERTVVHATWTPGDVDCFALQPAQIERTVDITVDTPAEIDLAVEMLAEGKVIGSANKGGKGVAEKLNVKVPPNVKPVIRVKNPDANATAEAKYDLSVVEATTGDNVP
jgi:hypothetical protein